MNKSRNSLRSEKFFPLDPLPMDIMMIRRLGINNRLAKVSGIQQEDGHVQDSLVAHHRFHHLIHYWGQQR
jgi:hypothetical protein